MAAFDDQSPHASGQALIESHRTPRTSPRHSHGRDVDSREIGLVDTGETQDDKFRKSRMLLAEGASDELKEFDIPEDAYGAAILAIVRDLPEFLANEEPMLNLGMACFAISINVLNLILQFGIVMFIYLNVVQPKVREVQYRYRSFHADVFSEDGTFQQELWDDYDRKPDLCQIAMTNRQFYYCTLFLWIVVMLKEFRTSEKLLWNVSSVAGCRSLAEMLQPQENGKIYIVAITRGVRISLYIMVCIPKLCICAALLWLGCAWLSATTRFEDLVMNAVAMEFVINIDSMLYEVMIPAEYKHEVAEINFMLPCSQGYDRATAMRTGFRQCIAYLVLSACFMFAYANLFQNVLPDSLDDVKTHCLKYMAEEEQPFCLQSTFSSLIGSLTGNGEKLPDCYPFGHHESGHWT